MKRKRVNLKKDRMQSVKLGLMETFLLVEKDTFSRSVSERVQTLNKISEAYTKLIEYEQSLKSHGLTL